MLVHYEETRKGRAYQKPKKKQKTITWAYLCGEKKQGARDTKRSREKIRKEKQGSTYAGKRVLQQALQGALGTLKSCLNNEFMYFDFLPHLVSSF